MDKITFDQNTRRVEVVKTNGNTYTIASYDNAHQSHRRGGFVLGDISSFRLSKRTTAKVLKHFYPDDSLNYLEKHGYIVS
jgi:hypothetical protein